MSNIVVISRFKEEVGWVSKIDREKFKIIIYNKGPDLELDGVEIIKLKNVGREADTYLHHMIENYNFISNEDRLFFLQGNPFDHSFDLSLLQKHLDSKQNFIPFGNRFAEVVGSRLGNDFPNGLPIIEFCKMLFSRVNIERGSFIKYYPGAQFSVTGSCIKNRHVEFYKFIKAYNARFNPLEAHLLERLWETIFNDKIVDNISNYEKSKAKCLENAVWGGNKIE